MKSQQVIYLSDVHVPYHDLDAWAVTLKVVKGLQPEGLFIGGDFIDFYAVSTFDKDPARALTLDEEIQATFTALQELKEAAPNAWVRFLPGNHEARLRKYGWVKAKALSKGLDLPGIFRLYDHPIKGLEIKWLPEGEFFTLGELTFAHGHEFGFRSSTHPARSILQRVGGNIIVGHWHVEDFFSLRLLNGKVYCCWVNPCLSTLQPEYTLHPQWDQGFSRIDFMPSGAFHVDQIPIFVRDGVKCTVVDREFYASTNVAKQQKRPRSVKAAH